MYLFIACYHHQGSLGLASLTKNMSAGTGDKETNIVTQLGNTTWAHPVGSSCGTAQIVVKMAPFPFSNPRQPLGGLIVSSTPPPG